MSGHSRWAGIKHKKGLADAKRGKLFTKLVREISVAAKQGGGSPENNPRLRKAMEDAHAASMPQENIQKAVARGTGELPGVVYEETTYEGYGPSGVAVFVEATTDNKNRTTSEIRKIFTQRGGSLGESGCVAWMFQKKGCLSVEKAKFAEEKLMSLAIDAGAEDFRSDDGEIYEIITLPADFEKVKEALKTSGVPILSSEITFLPQTMIPVSSPQAEQVLQLIGDLEENDDVKEVYSNFDIPQEVMDRVRS
jgi:YebC/PmpR family DNA-binding regulatory protein